MPKADRFAQNREAQPLASLQRKPIFCNKKTPEIRRFQVFRVRWLHSGYFVSQPKSQPSEAVLIWKGEARGRADNALFCPTGIKERRSKADFAPMWQGGTIRILPKLLADIPVSSITSALSNRVLHMTKVHLSKTICSQGGVLINPQQDLST